MTQVTHKELMPGVHLTAVQTHKFKTCMLAVDLLTPISEAAASENALIPAVLRRGTERYPDMESLSAALDGLYGGSIEPVVRRKGSIQCIGFTASFLDDAYAPGQTQILEPAAALLGEMLLRPAMENGGFRTDYVESERANLIDRIRAQINEKRSYSILRLNQEVCGGTSCGIDRLGSERSAAAVTPVKLWERYQKLLGTAQVSLYYCGSAPLERVENALRCALDALAGGARSPVSLEPLGPNAPKDAPRVVTEALDVTQGKLALGFRNGGNTLCSKDYPAFMVMNAIYGGTPTSKLFLNVREKLSLCYFASSMLDKFSAYLAVSSGIEFNKYNEAKAEILAQLDNCRTGKIEPWELEGGRRSVVSALQTSLDAQSRLEDYWLGQACAGLTETPEELALRVEAVTLDQVVACANALELDTVYFLKGREEQDHG